MPASSTEPAPSPQALATVTQGSAEPPRTYVVVLQKVVGASLGVDVTYKSSASWTRNGVFVARVLEDGLVADWNASHEESNSVCPGDFIFQVNGVHGDTVSMIQEMKVKQTLTLHLVRRTTAPPASPAAKAPVRKTPTVDELFMQLQDFNDKAVAALMLVALEKRSWIRDEVLRDIFDDLPQGPQEFELPPVPLGLSFSSGKKPAAVVGNPKAAAEAHGAGAEDRAVVNGTAPDDSVMDGEAGSQPDGAAPEGLDVAQQRANARFILAGMAAGTTGTQGEGEEAAEPQEESHRPTVVPVFQ